MTFDKIYEMILSIYAKVYTEKDVIKSIDEYQKFDDLLNKFAQNDSSLKIIFDNVKYRIVAASDNLEALSGFTKKDLDNYNSMIFLKALSFEHLAAPLFLAKWYSPISKQISQSSDVNPNDMLCVMCGLSLKLPNGKKMRILLRATIIELSENGMPVFCIVSIDDITHMLKSDFYWGRMSYGEACPHKFYYHSKEKKHVKQDIVSDREKQVLKLVADGKESKEIAQELFLSVNTVNNHRKNAIERTGAKDTTALIQLCKMLGMF